MEGVAALAGGGFVGQEVCEQCELFVHGHYYSYCHCIIYCVGVGGCMVGYAKIQILHDFAAGICYFCDMRRLIILTVWLMVMAGAARGMRTYCVATDCLPGGEGLVSVALPEGYFAAGDTVHYPTLYLLNGHGGDNSTWGRIVNLDSLASVYGIIIVCPAGLNSWYWDAPAQPDMRMESYMTGDLLCWADSTFRTIDSAEGRAITGLSMGGHGALWLAMRHPEIYGSAGSTSGGVDFTPWPGSWNIADRLGPYEGNEEVWREHTVMRVARGLEPGGLRIIMDCGTEDFFFEVNNRLHELLTLKGVEHVYLTGPGAHNGAYWGRSILPQMEFFFGERKR